MTKPCNFQNVAEEENVISVMLIAGTTPINSDDLRNVCTGSIQSARTKLSALSFLLDDTTTGVHQFDPIFVSWT